MVSMTVVLVAFAVATAASVVTMSGGVWNPNLTFIVSIVAAVVVAVPDAAVVVSPAPSAGNPMLVSLVGVVASPAVMSATAAVRNMYVAVAAPIVVEDFSNDQSSDDSSDNLGSVVPRFGFWGSKSDRQRGDQSQC